MGDTHLESLTRLLDEIHMLTPGVSLIAPSVAKLPIPPRSNIYLDRMNIPALSPTLLRALLDQDDVFALLDLNKNVLWTLSASRTGLFYDPSDAAGCNAIAKLAYTASHDAAPAPRRTSRPYDVIASRTSELVNQTVPTADRSLVDLASKWEALLKEHAPQEIVKARDRLANIVRLIREMTAKGSSPGS